MTIAVDWHVKNQTKQKLSETEVFIFCTTSLDIRSTLQNTILVFQGGLMNGKCKRILEFQIS